MIYWTFGGMGSNSWVNQFYPKGNKVLWVYFSPETVYTEEAASAGIYITKSQYDELLSSVQGNELPEDVVSEFFGAGKYQDAFGPYVDVEDIIKSIKSNAKIGELADAWYKYVGTFFNRNDVIGDYVDEHLYEAFDSGKLNIDGITDYDEVMDYLDSGKFAIKEMLSKVSKYLK